jgi:hypothetical protein
VIRKLCIFERVIDRNMKQLENSMETHNVYLEELDICFINYTANVNAILSSSHRRWLRPLKFSLEALEGTVTSEVGIPGLALIPIGKSCVK